MGVDWIACNRCGETFPDCGDYVTCESCCTEWCSYDCAEEDGYIPEHCSKHPDLDNRDLMEEYREDHCNHDDCCDCEYYAPDSCKYCRHEDYDDETLLEKALELLDMSREDLVKKVNEDKET